MQDGKFQVTGEVIKCERGRFYRVRLDNGHLIRATPCGKMHINNLQIIIGDRVIVEMSGYDLDRGRIMWRYR